MKQVIFKILRIVKNILFWFMLITYVPLAYLSFNMLMYIAKEYDIEAQSIEMPYTLTGNPITEEEKHLMDSLENIVYNPLNY